MLGYLKKTLRVIGSGGIRALYMAAYRQMDIFRLNREYRCWIREFDEISNEDRHFITERIGEFERRPLISVLMPVYNVDEKWLRAAIESVLRQLYANWELCIADDHSDKSRVREILEEYAAADARIKVVFRERNGHISAASNSALELVTGEFTALMDHDDELSEDALFQVAAEINAFPEASMIYSDEDKITTRDKRIYPWFKPAWSPDLFYSLNLVTHLCVYRTDILRSIGGFREGLEGSQDYDLALRFIERISAATIRHIPHILYHWRAISGSVAFDSSEKSYAADLARMAVTEHFQRLGIPAECVRGENGTNRTIYKLSDDPPLVSVIIAAKRSASSLIGRILEKTDYPKLEIIVADETGADTFSENNRVRALKTEISGYYARLNHAARTSAGSIIVFLDESTIDLSKNWLSEITGRALNINVGAVCLKIVDSNDRISHAGYILGINGGLGQAHLGARADGTDALKRLCSVQNFAAVSAGCMAIRKDAFDEAGGFDDANFGNHYADVDLCLRLFEKGLRNVWTPWATIVRSGDDELPLNNELVRLRDKWPHFFESDPFLNPNLSKSREDYSLAFPPRIRRI